MWRKGIPIEDVSTIVSCRAQVATLGEYRLMNVYAPSGSDKKHERSLFFGEDIFQSLLSDSSGSWIMGGDFNAILGPMDVERGVGYDQKKFQAQADLVKTANVSDVFRVKHPTLQEFTFHRRGCASSRLDKFFICNNLLSHVQTINHVACLSDHFGVKMELTDDFK